MKKLIIGLATGRCGTKSLVTLLNIQKDVEFYHEHCRLPWIVDMNRANKYFDAFEEYDNSIILGDIGVWYVMYAKALLERFGKKVIFVRLVRDDHEVVKSYMNKVSRGNHWTIYGSKYRTGREVKSIFDECYPKFDEPKEQAIASFIRIHYRLCRHIESIATDQVKTFGMNLFTSREEQQRLFEFLKIREPCYCTSIMENKRFDFKKFLRCEI